MTKTIDQMDRFGPAFAKNFESKGKTIAFIAVHHSHEGEEGPGLGIAIANELGFMPIPKFYYATDDHDTASARADELNEKVLGLSDEAAMGITVSTMGGLRYESA